MAGRARIPAAVATVHRFVFVIAFGVTGFVLGRELDVEVLSPHLEVGAWQQALGLLSPVAGALAGVSASPFAQRLFETELAEVEAAAERLSAAEVVGGTAGLGAGLLIALLLRTLFAGLVTAVGAAADATLALAALIFAAFATFFGARVAARLRREAQPAVAPAGREPALLDTSAIIDGRILEVVRCGFHAGPFRVPRFVVAELQGVADASDPVRRARGRRGLELLDRLRGIVEVVIDGEPGRGEAPVDALLVRAARERGCDLVTTDANLQRVARLEGIAVLNVNELAQALRPTLAAGETIEVVVTREGREPEQGVGYLDDGTMIVVEGGRGSIGEALAVTVTSVLQTAAGRMVFARMA